MTSEITIHEIKSCNIEGGYVVDGFPSTGYASAIAAESMVRTSDYEMVAYLDSDDFPPVSIVKNGVPNYPVCIFVNEAQKIAVFLSHLALSTSLSREIAKIILEWSNQHKCSFVVSSMAMTLPSETKKEVCGVGSTENAQSKIKEAAIEMSDYASIPGIPGMLLNQGRFSNQDVIVILYYPEKQGIPDFKSGAKLCTIMPRIIPNLSCNMKLIEEQSVTVEKFLRNTHKETKRLDESIYR